MVSKQPLKVKRKTNKKVGQRRLGYFKICNLTEEIFPETVWNGEIGFM